MPKRRREAAARPCIIQLVGLARGLSHPFDGRYVVRYHPGPASMSAGQCLLVTTSDARKAKVYADAESAHAEWARVDPRAPVRPDGQPNRPLTAWTIEILPAPG
jgi:hypothetical protein